MPTNWEPCPGKIQAVFFKYGPRLGDSRNKGPLKGQTCETQDKGPGCRAVKAQRTYQTPSISNRPSCCGLFLLFDLDNIFVLIRPAVRAYVVGPSQVVAVGALGEVRGPQSQVAAAPVPASL